MIKIFCVQTAVFPWANYCLEGLWIKFCSKSLTWMPLLVFFKLIRSFDPWGNVFQYCHLPSYSYLNYQSLEDLVVPQDQYCGKGTKAKNIVIFLTICVVTIFFSAAHDHSNYNVLTVKVPPPKKLSIVTLSHSAPLQAPVVQRLDSAIHPINHYPVDKYYGNQLRNPLDSNLSGVALSNVLTTAARPLKGMLLKALKSCLLEDRY